MSVRPDAQLLADHAEKAFDGCRQCRKNPSGQYINEVRHQRPFDDGFFRRFSFSKWHLVNAIEAFPCPGLA
jgi:hypothetical protein